MTTKYYMVLNDYPDHAAALGCLLGHWAIFETHLMRMTEYLLQVDHHRADFVYKEFVNTKSKITLLMRLNHWLTTDDTIKKEINDLLSNALKLNGKRNDFVHARWLSGPYGDDSNQLIRINDSSPGKIKNFSKSIERFTPEDIQGVGEEIAKLSQSFAGLLNRVLPVP